MSKKEKQTKKTLDVQVIETVVEHPTPSSVLIQSMPIPQSKKELKKIIAEQKETINERDVLIQRLKSIRQMDDEQHEELIALRREKRQLEEQIKHLTKMTPAERRKYANDREEAIQMMERVAISLGQKVDVRELFKNIV
jgi:predicted nuclease with TOPRIM domain